MLQAIVKQTERRHEDGYANETFHVIEFECAELETVLTGGGQSEHAYDFRQVTGVAVVKKLDT